MSLEPAANRSDRSSPPAMLGPYRVERLLGRGGMGEVYQGYDDRLDRPVALKRIKPDARDPEAGRARFRREARALARLSHGNLVQVYDWVEAEGDDWLVMELVEGRPLSALLAGGPLPADQAVRIARDVAAGLAAAHRAGIVHRDLKADNVMLTAGGEVKILDFGLARRFAGPDPVLSSLSGTGQIVGTVNFMSPEQALGQPVDHRSDLFSLGILLYQMLTGVLPFRSENAIETLTRICTQKPPAVIHLAPETPAPLSDLVDRLLQKDKARRPERTEEVMALLAELAGSGETHPEMPALTPPPGLSVPTLDPTAPGAPAAVSGRGALGWPRRRLLAAAAALLALALLAFTAWRWLASPPPATSVAVPPTAAPEDQHLAAGAVHTGLLRALLGFQGLAVREPPPGETDDDPVKLARAVATDEVVTSRLDCAGEDCQVELRRLRADGSLSWVHRFDVPVHELLRLSASVAEQVRGAYPDLALRAGIADLQVTETDYAKFLDLSRRYRTRDSGTSPAAFLTELAQIERTSPRFLEAYLLETNIARQQFVVDRDQAALGRARAAIARATELAPDDPRALRAAFLVELNSGRLQQAAAVLARAQRVQPDDPGFQGLAASLLEKQGKSQEGLALIRRAAGREPSWLLLQQASDMALRAGDVNGARRYLEIALERSPDRYNALSRLAQLELLNGNPQRAAELYETLVKRAPDETELTNLGMAYLLLNRYEAADQSFRSALKEAPSSPMTLLNLADTALLRGDRPGASAFYSRVLENAARDPDPDALLTTRAQALAHLGRSEEAVAAIQEAQRHDAGDPQVAYAASLVYALVGDETSARMNARKALAGGVDRRWFAFPWFDAVRPQLAKAAGAGAR
ncbi:MAG TPA: protein kinase [Thermoanaerobaculia bacterium]|nr:protein kinase [Thermoanaerobaculia bacterium]